MSSASKNFRWCHRFASRIGSRVSRSRERWVTHFSVGRWGERAARRHLARHGVIALQSNWRTSHLEADIIAAHQDQVVVVEVKTRHHSLQRRFPGIDAVTAEKWEHLQKLGQRWMRNNGPLCRRFSLRTFRVDVVEIYYRPLFGPFRITANARWHRSARLSSGEPPYPFAS